MPPPDYDVQADWVFARYRAKLNDLGRGLARGITRTTLQGKSFDPDTNQTMEQKLRAALPTSTWPEDKKTLERCIDIAATVATAVQETGDITSTTFDTAGRVTRVLMNDRGVLPGPTPGPGPILLGGGLC